MVTNQESLQPVQTATPVIEGSRQLPETNTEAGPEESSPAAPIVRRDPSADLQAVNAALRQWAQAMVSNDPNREAACYAPEIDHYFLQSGVTQDFVRRYLAQVHRQGTLATAFNVSNLSETPQPDGSVEARLTKEVTLNTPAGPRQVTTHAVLVFKHVDGAWKISSERDLRSLDP